MAKIPNNAFTADYNRIFRNILTPLDIPWCILDINCDIRYKGSNFSEEMTKKLKDEIKNSHVFNDTIKKALVESKGFVIEKEIDEPNNKMILIPLIENNICKGILLAYANITNLFKSGNFAAKESDDADYLLGLYKNIVSSVTQYIVCANDKGSILIWNNTLAKKTGLNAEQMVGLSIYSKDFPKEATQIADALMAALERDGKQLNSLLIYDINNNPLQLLVRASIIKDKYGIKSGAVLIGDETYGRIGQIQLKPKNSYISLNDDSGMIYPLLTAEYRKNYALICLSREDPARDFGFADEILYFNGKKHEFSHMLENLRQKVLKKKCIIVIERIDYLKLKYGFEKTMELFYQLNDLIHNSESCLILNASKEYFSGQEMIFLKQEFQMIRFSDDDAELSLSEREREILRFADDKNSFHQIATFGMISSRLNMSRNTTKNVLETIQNKGLIRISKKGRIKQISLTDTGLKYL